MPPRARRTRQDGAFDIHSRYALLTYSQCGDLSPATVGEFFTNLGFKLIIGRENHANGGIHLHCFVDFIRKRRFRAPRCFDIEGRHPNVEPSHGTPERGWDYVIKDGDVVFKSLDRPVEEHVAPRNSSRSHDSWSTITGASDRESFWDLVHELDPKSAACSFTQLQKYCDWKFAPSPPVYGSPDGITFVGGETDGRDDWLLQSGIGNREPFIGTLGGAFHIGCAGQGFHIATRGVPPSGRNLPLPRCKVLVC
ncbi:RepA [Sewage-associated gemycircularvirus-7b]|uniref:RepA n=1 Tax=Sewage-associated gemycircularvirus-7b TaxID=1519405 RepID=A0A0A7CL55_9VIRU|nr:RepA [Sewage-associated gemycircularvirus-7b]AIF34844.1 RepA [Sewage-associated gemycircularvirus-7b]